MKEKWTVAFEYRPVDDSVCWEYWDEKQFRNRDMARRFAKKMKQRKSMAAKRLRLVHYKRFSA